MALTTLYSVPIPTEGTPSSEPEFRNDLEIDAEGRLTVRTYRNADGSEGVFYYLFDPAGLLYKTISRMKGDLLAETVNEYDRFGRIQKTTSSAGSLESAVYSYDEDGRKTKTQTSLPEDYRPDLGFGGSVFEANDHAPNFLRGGTAITLYDEKDRPYEIEVRDEKGDLVKRLIRRYNEKGLVVEEAEILPDPITILPGDIRDRIVRGSGTSSEDLRKQLSNLVGPHPGPISVKFEYDALGRVIRTRRRIFDREETIEDTYNEHGDVAMSVTRGTNTYAGASVERRYSEAIYSYQYDSQGNWTEKIVSQRLSPDDVFTVTLKSIRSFTYY